MKQQALLKQCKAVARKHGTEFLFLREGRSHTVYRVAGQNIPVPRHSEIAEGTARGILADVEEAAKG